MKEFDEVEVGLYIRQMENMVRLFPVDDQRKIQMARETLRQMQKMDPVCVTIAMVLVGGEGFTDLIKRREEVMKDLAKNLP
jgi:hypothetical protein